MAVESAESTAVVDLLDELIRLPSVTPDDAGCQRLLADRLEQLGFVCEHMPFGDVSNLWARRGDAGPLLCFAGHTDVVPPGHIDAWESDPFEPTVRDGRLFGRGAADMKGALAAMIVAVERFLVDDDAHRGSLAFLVTSDEEGPARDGTVKVVETLVDRGDTIDWCVLGEPSSHRALGDTIRIGRRGSLSGSLRVRGTQGHVAYPQLADNPIRRFAPVLHRLHETAWDGGNENFPPTSFEIVDLRSGAGASNVTPDELSAEFNLRYSTEWDHEKLRREVERILSTYELEFELEWHLSGEPFLTREGTLTEAVAKAVRESTGQLPELSTGGGTSDGRFISPAGADVVELGLVNASIHKVNEHVDVADLARLAGIYRRIMELLLSG